MQMLLDLIHEPALAIKNVKKKPSLTNALLLVVFGVVIFYIASLIPTIKSGLTTQGLINSFWSALVLFIVVVAYAFLAKIPFEIITDKKQNAFAYSLSANAMWFSLFSIGFLVMSVFVLIGTFIDKAPTPVYGGTYSFYPSSYQYPLEHNIYQVVVGIGLFFFLWFLIKGISIATRALKEFFDVDYLIVLVVSGITGTIVTVIFYLMLIGFGMLIGAGMLGGMGGRSF